MFDNYGMMTLLNQLLEVIRNLSNEVVGARVRTRALLEVLEEKGVLAPGEFDDRAALVWDRDYEELVNELLATSEPASRSAVEDTEQA